MYVGKQVIGVKLSLLYGNAGNPLCPKKSSGCYLQNVFTNHIYIYIYIFDIYVKTGFGIK